MQRPILETRRLILRPFENADAARVQELAGDPLVAATTLNIPHPYSDGLAEEWISIHELEFIEQKSLIMAICLKSDMTLIGAVGLTLKMEHRLGELGYWIGVAYWNNGYCTEASEEMIRYGFERLRLHKIFATYFAENIPSGKVMQKVGMIPEAHMRKHILHWGDYKDLVSYGILANEYLATKER